MNTLDPKKLTRADYLDLSGRVTPSVLLTAARVLPGRGVTAVRPTPLEGRGCPSMTYPPNTAGFLYLHMPPPGLPAVAAEIRFRVTNDADPASFSRGVDYRYLGLPWRRPVILVLHCEVFNVPGWRYGDLGRRKHGIHGLEVTRRGVTWR